MTDYGTQWASEVYSHRNGETEPPTIEGTFDFFGKRYGKHLGPKNVEVEVIETFGHLSVMEAYPVGFEFYEGRWWGPITGPWDNNV